jgi:hypothetical protein
MPRCRPLNLVGERLDVIGLPGSPPMFKLVNHLAYDRVDALLGQSSVDGLFFEGRNAPPRPSPQRSRHGEIAPKPQLLLHVSAKSDPCCMGVCEFCASVPVSFLLTHTKKSLRHKHICGVV